VLGVDLALEVWDVLDLFLEELLLTHQVSNRVFEHFDICEPFSILMLAFAERALLDLDLLIEMIQFFISPNLIFIKKITKLPIACLEYLSH
jgi:hypothetical protein